ncbi:unnamed protein product [Orchesella dallaii]|uniref:G-protein coupled receptors family 1 profile domain-containing protein n=1 Tax=Orchesella dallaii TaxID=48710 RepID=A0ABP1QIM3_9HEXA
MTVLITIERFLVVAIPSRAPNWFTTWKCKLFSAGVLLFSFLMAFPRYSSVYISPNHVGRNINSTKEVEFIILPSIFNEFWYVTLKGFFDTIDFWLPLPLLLLFNAVLYLQIRKFKRNRRNLNVNQKKNISAANMFVPVVIVLFLCNIVPIVHYYYIHSGVIHREAIFGMFVSEVVNSAANLPIYYFRGSGFRKECRALLTPYFPVWANDSKKSEETGEEKGQNTKTTSGCIWYNQTDDKGSSQVLKNREPT